MLRIKNNKGISIIESLVAISIIAVGIIGVVSLVLQAIQVQYINKNALIASQLAQEGMEIVRNIRDENWLIANQNYYEYIAQPGVTMNYAVDIFDVDGSTPSLQNVTGINDANTNLKKCEDYFYHENSYPCSTPTPTIFKRMITTNLNSLDDYIEVVCLIQWLDRGKSYQFTTKELLYNWTGL